MTETTRLESGKLYMLVANPTSPNPLYFAGHRRGHRPYFTFTKSLAKPLDSVCVRAWQFFLLDQFNNDLFIVAAPDSILKPVKKPGGMKILEIVGVHGDSWRPFRGGILMLLLTASLGVLRLSTVRPRTDRVFATALQISLWAPPHVSVKRVGIFHKHR